MNSGTVEDGREPETFREFLHLRFTNRDLAFALSGKLDVHEKLTTLGFPVPELYRTWKAPEEVVLKGLPSSFALKPNTGWSKQGVFVLHRIAGGQGYWDAMRQRRVWGPTVRAELKNLERKRKRKQKLMALAEERVRGEHRPNGIPLDYKFYTFNGEIRLIIQIDRNQDPPGFAFFHRNFSPWDYSKYLALGARVGSAEPVVPSCADELLDIVSRVSRELKTPFVSIDAYASKRGPLIGELTRTPGGAYYAGMILLSPEFDRDLALSWKRAAAELGRPLGRIGRNETLPKAPR